MKRAHYKFIKNRPAAHGVCYYDDDGKRRVAAFKLERDALDFLARCNASIVLPDELKFSVEERIAFARIKKICSDFGISLDVAADIIKANKPKELSNGKSFSDARDAFLSNLAERGGRQLTVNDYRARLNRFAADVEIDDVAAVSPQLAADYLARIKSPLHALRVLRPFFKFCVEAGWIVSSPFDGAKIKNSIVEKHLPPVLSVENTVKLLNNTPRIWQPTVALMAFCGIRPNEICSDVKAVLPVSAVDFKAKKITVPAAISKTHTARIIQPPANIWAWLEPLKERPESEAVAPASETVFRRVKASTGVKLEKDVLRHSFASYAFHYLGAERAVEILGHVGGFAVFAKHYKGLATPDEAEQYFSILPQK